MKVQIRTVDGDVLLESREMEALPNIGEEIVIDDEIYHTATPPSEVINDEATVYVSKLTDA